MIILGLSGSASNGKDKFYSLLHDYLSTLGITSMRRAFADFLKAELYPLITQSFGFSPFTDDPDEKSLIRPIMVAYGCAMREKTGGSYWINKLSDSLEQFKDHVDVMVVTDVRFNNHDKDEVPWVKSKGGKIVFIERYVKGEVVPPPNETEKINNELVKPAADFNIVWGDGYDSPEDTVKKFADEHIIPAVKNGGYPKV